MTKVAVVYGTRPEAIKVAPMVQSLQERDVELQLISTGQHREMLHGIEGVFNLEPGVRLDVMRAGQSLSEMFGRIAREMEEVLRRSRPEVLVVHGDTTTAAASALAAFHCEVPVAHLEAGLRSGNFWRPFPEEGNRRLVTRLAQLHLAPTNLAASNLRGEGVDDSDIVVTGNTVIDAVQWAHTKTAAHPWPASLAHLENVDPAERLVLVTLHRRENQAEGIRRVCRALALLSLQYPQLRIVFPMHPNPLVRSTVLDELGGIANAHLIEPVDYVTMIKLLSRSWLVVTDSGGIQEEAPAFGVPVLVARDTTERPEAVDAGVALLIGGDGGALLRTVSRFIKNEADWRVMAHAVNPFGDGHAAGRAVDAIERFAYTYRADGEVGVKTGAFR